MAKNINSLYSLELIKYVQPALNNVLLFILKTKINYSVKILVPIQDTTQLYSLILKVVQIF
jgi:hypothetical protein